MNNQICKVHNEPAFYCEQETQQNLVFLCKLCLQQKFQIQNTVEVDKEGKQQLKTLEMQFNQIIKQLNDFAQALENFTQQIQQKLSQFKQFVEQNISDINEKKIQVKNISNDFTYLQLTQTNEQKKIINNQQAHIILQLNNKIKEIEVSIKFDLLNQLLNNLSTQENCKLEQFNDSQKIKDIEKKIDYKMIQQLSYKQSKKCSAIAFNKDATIMIAGCESLIKVFELKNDKLTELEELDGHLKRVFCLQFMQKSNQFISGSDDSTMIIWENNNNHLWQCIQVLTSHTNTIWCITMNKNENLLISGSYDKRIKFWQKQTDTWSCYQSINCQGCINSVSLNEQQDKLIASVKDKILLIQQLNKGWMITQEISVDQSGDRLCYISQNQFVFQPAFEKNMQIFDFDTQDQTYKKGQELQLQDQVGWDDSLFPIQYISQIQIIIVKNGCHVHLVKKNQNGQFTVEQSINFNTPCIFGCMSDDGRFIATWDDESKEIQIRKFDF